MPYSGWFITSELGVLCLNRRGHAIWRQRPKRGIPAGAMDCGTEALAHMEIGSYQRLGFWPLVREMRPVCLVWS